MTPEARWLKNDRVLDEYYSALDTYPLVLGSPVVKACRTASDSLFKALPLSHGMTAVGFGTTDCHSAPVRSTEVVESCCSSCAVRAVMIPGSVDKVRNVISNAYSDGSCVLV